MRLARRNSTIAVPFATEAGHFQAAGVPTVIFGGEEYGTGSSRDWAAKGTQLLGIKAVVARSFERIHRSNLVGMGILPLEFLPGQTWHSLGLNGEEKFDFIGLNRRPSRYKLAATGLNNRVIFNANTNIPERLIDIISGSDV